MDLRSGVSVTSAVMALRRTSLISNWTGKTLQSVPPRLTAKIAAKRHAWMIFGSHQTAVPTLASIAGTATAASKSAKKKPVMAVVEEKTK